MSGLRNRANSPDTSGLLQTLLGQLHRRVRRGHTPESEESAGRPRMVNWSETKHWTTIVVTLNEVSAECKCGWVEVIEGDRNLPNRVGEASKAARRHRDETIPEIA